MYECQQRSLLALIRLGILPLSIEQRLCPLCSISVETELHFICIREKIKKQRDILYDRFTLCNFEFKDFSDEQKFIYLFKSEWKMLTLAQYMLEIWDLRGKQYTKLETISLYIYIHDYFKSMC